MAKVILHGELERFNLTCDVAVSSVAEALRAVESNRPGFMRALQDTDNQVYQVTIDGDAVSEEHLALLAGPISSHSVIHVIPVISGSKSAGGAILTGMAIVAVAAITAGTGGIGGAVALSELTGGYAMAASIGVSMIVSGFASMLAPSPDLETGEDTEKLKSSKFSGAVNTTKQGLPIPVGYGQLIVGGSVVSAGLESYEISSTVAEDNVTSFDSKYMLHFFSLNSSDSQPIVARPNDIIPVVRDSSVQNPENYLYSYKAYNTAVTPSFDPADYGYGAFVGGHEQTAFGSPTDNGNYLVIDSRDKVLKSDNTASLEGAEALCVSLWFDQLLVNTSTLFSLRQNDFTLGTSAGEVTCRIDNITKELVLEVGTAVLKFNLLQNHDTNATNRIPTVRPTLDPADGSWWETPIKLGDFIAWKHLVVNVPKSGKLSSVHIYYLGVLHFPISYTGGTAESTYTLNDNNSLFLGGESWHASTPTASMGIDSIRVMSTLMPQDAALSLMPRPAGMWDTHFESVQQRADSYEARGGYSEGDGGAQAGF